MPNLLSEPVVDERPLWVCSRILSLLYNRAGVPTTVDFARSIQDGYVTSEFHLAEGHTPTWMSFSFRGLNLCVISGVTSTRTALSFVTDYGEILPATPLNRTATTGGDPILTAMLEVYRNNPAKTIFAGWSYGGVIAQYLAAAWLGTVNNDDRHVITYGAPRAAQTAFGPVYNGIPTTRVCNVRDPIPFLVPWSTEDAVAYWAFRAYRAFAEPNNWTQFGRGVRLSDSGLFWEYQMPSFPEGGIGTSVVGWATGLLTEPVGEHTIAAYEARLSQLAADAIRQDAQRVRPGLVPPGPPPGVPLPNPRPEAMAQRIAIPEREPEPPPPPPPGVRVGPTFYAASIRTGETNRKEWWVYHWETPLFRARNKTSAKRAASRLNSLQVAWLTSTAGEQADLLDAIQFEFPNALST